MVLIQFNSIHQDFKYLSQYFFMRLVADLIGFAWIEEFDGKNIVVHDYYHDSNKHFLQNGKY